jgi:hypothetical protein
MFYVSSLMLCSLTLTPAMNESERPAESLSLTLTPLLLS